jgi:hypothetical protein
MRKSNDTRITYIGVINLLYFFNKKNTSLQYLLRKVGEFQVDNKQKAP